MITWLEIIDEQCKKWLNCCHTTATNTEADNDDDDDDNYADIEPYVENFMAV